MRDILRHLNDFQTKYRGQRRKKCIPQKIITRYGMEVSIPVTLYDPKSLKRSLPEPIQEPCYTVRPMSKKQIFKLDREGIMADARSVAKGGLNLQSDNPDKLMVFKPYGKNTPNDRKGKALLRRFLHGAILPGMMSVGEWRKLKDMGVDLQ